MTKSNKKYSYFSFLTTFLNASPIVDIETVRQSVKLESLKI